MAIVWSTQYPGQVSVDPNWPHGKPRNVAVPGDGSGTPLEAAWVSDLAGWQAALLQEAGITPSGQPDHVGASDYTNAIKAIAGGGLAGFTSTEHTWTAQQTFQAGHATGDWGIGGEAIYVDPATGLPTPKLHTLRLPLSDWVSEADAVSAFHIGWHLNPVKSGSYEIGWIRYADAAATTGLYTEFQMPTGARLESVVARVQGIPFGGDSSITMNVGLTQIENDFLFHRPVEKNSGALDGTTLLQVNAAADLPWLGPFDGSSQTLLIHFTGIRSCVMNWVKVSFWDLGPRNY